MYKELFFHVAYLCRAWEYSCDFTIDLLKILILNILPSCGNICISSFRCRPSGVHVVGPYSMFLLPVVNNPDSLFRCTRRINKADFNIVNVMQFTL